MRRLACRSARHRALAAALLLAAAALAGAPAQAADAKLSEADRSFLAKEAHGATYELRSAKPAVGKATRRDVKDYAEKLVRDHEKYNAALPDGLDAADEARMRELGGLSGKAFDDRYVQEALRINAGDERDGEAEKGSTKSQAIKDFLAAFDDMDKDHEKLARKLAAGG